MTPEARTIQESAGEQILFDPELVSDPTRELFDPAIWGDRAAPHTEGRGTVWQLESAKERWILKRYLREDWLPAWFRTATFSWVMSGLVWPGSSDCFARSVR